MSARAPAIFVGSAAPGDPPLLERGEGSYVYDQGGRRWLDLVMGFGAAFLGHGHPGVTASLQAQAGRLIASGRHPTGNEGGVNAQLSAVLPAGLRPGALGSTGMEAAELALRVAAVHTGRCEFAGFARSMHGKSAMTAALCWDNAPVRPGGLHTLPHLDSVDEDGMLEALRACLAPGRIAALFVEPIQGSGGGHQPSPAFQAEAMALCRAAGTLFVMDEILTGLYRTGPAFLSCDLPSPPDLLLFAKNMGNGFPVSGLALGPGVTIRPEALPGSTFAGNPLALAAVQATLGAMAQLPMEHHVAALGQIARERFDALAPYGAIARGRGALWCIELPRATDQAHATALLREAGILASVNGRVVRLLPAATLEPAAWSAACDTVAAVCRRVSVN